MEHIGNGTRDGGCLGGVLNLDEQPFWDDGRVVFGESRQVLSQLVAKGRSGCYKLPFTPKGRSKEGGHGAREAATLSGFKSLSHFYRVFRELAGGSPGNLDSI